MRWRAPGCTLFPYTTLFRSLPPLRDEAHHADRAEPLRRRRSEEGRRPRRPHHVQDRKSTRLNSSHVEISYAVFCLKKKTQNIKQFLTMHRCLYSVDQISAPK